MTTTSLFSTTCPSCLLPLGEEDTDDSGLCNSCLFKVQQTKKIRELEAELKTRREYTLVLEDIICRREVGVSLYPLQQELFDEIVGDFKDNARQEHQDDEDARNEGRY
jgi:hypothetical protein